MIKRTLLAVIIAIIITTCLSVYEYVKHIELPIWFTYAILFIVPGAYAGLKDRDND